jgi:hypothetical protein
VLTSAAISWAGAAGVPAFVLLQGVEAFRRSGTLGASALSRLLVARGLMLILLELTALRAAAWFTLDYGESLGVLCRVRAVCDGHRAATPGHALVSGAERSSFMPWDVRPDRGIPGRHGSGE